MSGTVRPTQPIDRLTSPATGRSLAQRLVLCLATAFVAGCGSMTTGNDGWAYTGADPTLRSPAPAISAMTGDLTPEARMQLARDSLELWKQRTSEAVAAAKSSCAKETGEFATPGTWTGYSSAIKSCMRAHGWQRASNPL
jgi:hypothetical protein